LQFGKPRDDVAARRVLSIFDDAPPADNHIAHGCPRQREDD
jgi:hypothetical protein